MIPLIFVIRPHFSHPKDKCTLMFKDKRARLQMTTYDNETVSISARSLSIPDVITDPDKCLRDVGSVFKIER